MFKAINHLLFEKATTELREDLISEFTPYVTQRYLSFHKDGIFVPLINQSTNVYQQIFEGEDLFLFYDHIIPKTRKQYLKYVKKDKRQKEEEKLQEIPDFYSKKEWTLLTSSAD